MTEKWRKAVEADIDSTVYRYLLGGTQAHCTRAYILYVLCMYVRIMYALCMYVCMYVLCAYYILCVCMYYVRIMYVCMHALCMYVYLLTYLLTPWCRVLLEKLTGLQLVKKFPAFHGTRRFITALTSVRQISLSWANPIQST